MTRIAVLHAYSATNAGDGLLVDAALDLLEEAFPGSEYTVLARYPETFGERDGVRFLSTRWLRAASRAGVRTLRRLDEFDLVVGVGGGYLRFGSLLEGLKTSGAHLPQLIAAARTSTPTVYLPQSVGPEGTLVRAVLRRLLRHIDLVCLRDDRSVAELRLPNAVRVPDTALLDARWRPRTGSIRTDEPVFSVRPVRGPGRRLLRSLASALRPFDGWVQSTGAGNDDRRAVEDIRPVRTLEREEFVEGGRRVVVAVRLHAALMALRAGHWVVHLAYERKGFGAFGDLGLHSFVQSVYGFSPTAVVEQVRSLCTHAEARRLYDDAVSAALAGFAEDRRALTERLESMVPTRRTDDQR